MVACSARLVCGPHSYSTRLTRPPPHLARLQLRLQLAREYGVDPISQRRLEGKPIEEMLLCLPPRQGPARPRGQKDGAADAEVGEGEGDWEEEVGVEELTEEEVMAAVEARLS